MDTSVTVSNLLTMAGQVEDPEARNDFMISALDIMGLEAPESLRKKPENEQVTPEGQGPAPEGLDALGPMPSMPFEGGGAPPTEQSLTTAAAVPTR
jgi:hypothetical protein